MKVEMFHAFYQRIEEIQTTIVKVDPLVIESIDCGMKDEDESEDVNNIDDKTLTVDSKYDSHFDDNFWREDSDESQSNTLAG